MVTWPSHINLTVVLYSGRDYRWKIADFGISTEGTTKRAQTTQLARGTPSYRAPEVVKDEVQQQS
jgi:serine/threonine protein kinase